MSRIEHVSVRARLLGIILVVALPLAGVMGYVWWQSLQEGRNLAIAQLNADARLIERDLRQLRQDTEWVLAHMVDAVEMKELRTTACSERARYLYEIQPALPLVTLWNRDGRLVCSSSEPGAQPAIQAHQPTFNFAIATDGLYISDIFRGPVTGRQMMAFTYPVKDNTGTTVGLLSLPVLLDYFLRPLRSLERAGPGYAAGIIDSKDILVARIPNNEKWSGVIGTGDAVVEASRSGGSGIVPDIGIDGIKRIYVYKTIPEMGWRVYVGIEETVLFAGYREQLLFGSLLFFVVVTLSLVYAFYQSSRISGPLENLVRVADAVTAGDHSRRASIEGDKEISRVGQHLNSMLDALANYRESLRVSNQRQHDLSDRLQRAEENERGRISRELHDQIGQELTALTLDLETISRRSSPSPDLLARAIVSVARILDQVRDITLSLRPRQLDDLGLLAALRSHAARYISSQGIKVHFDAALATNTLSPGLEATCFRITQEALTNILRHADARNVWIKLHVDTDTLNLQIRDDGRGFDANAAFGLAQAGRSSGLSNLLDRAELAGGRLTIASSPGQGTTIDVILPLAQPPVDTTG